MSTALVAAVRERIRARDASVPMKFRIMRQRAHGSLAASTASPLHALRRHAADPLTFLTVGAILAGVALLACWIPALRTTRVDPLLALRSE